VAALIGAVIIARAGGTAPSAAADTAKDKTRKDMQQEEGCGGEQQYLEHDALEERAELVRVEQDRAARDVVEGDKLDRAVVAAVIGIGHAADGIAGLDGSGDLLGDIRLKLEILYVKLLGEQGNEIVLGDEDDLVGIGRELDFGVGDLLPAGRESWR